MHCYALAMLAPGAPHRLCAILCTLPMLRTWSGVPSAATLAPGLAPSFWSTVTTSCRQRNMQKRQQ